MLGRTIVIVLCLLAVLFSVPAASPAGLNTWISLAASSTAFVAMAINQVLAMRLRIFDPMFGGIDRMYHFHRQLGMVILALILVHYFITPDFQGKQLTAGLNALAKQVGEYAFYAFLVLLAVSLIKKIPYTNIKLEIPYHLWRWSHRLIGVFFLAIAFHQFFIKRPFDGTYWLANYLNIFAAIGIAAFIYTQVLAFLKRRKYRVTAVEKLASATVIEAKARGRGIKAKPGQFGFLSFQKGGLREPHPFTIAGMGTGTGPDDSKGSTIRFAIKPLGDYTARLRELAEVGDDILVEGGYGRFTHARGGDKQVWLAGGIGITPFLAMADSLPADNKRQIHLVHCVRDSSEAVRSDILAAKAQSTPGFSFHLYDSKAEGRIDATKLSASAPFDVHGADLWFCGPPPLREAIVKGLRALGKKLGRIEFERFEFR